jgi:hypothetical protein
MNTTDAKNVAIAFMSLVIVLVVFASSVFYNSIEGPLVAACLILLVLLNKDILTHAKDVKIIFLINLLFACSVLSTGVNFYTRQQVSLAEAFSDASAIILASVLGFFVYIAFRNPIIVRYRLMIVSLFAFGLFIYCITYPGARVWDYDRRYIIGIGLLFTIISLSLLVTYQPSSWRGVVPLVAFNTINLYVLFIAIESRTMTLALGFAWLITLVVTPHKKNHKVVFTLIPVMFCSAIQFVEDYGSASLKRYEALYSLGQHAIQSVHTTNRTQNATGPSTTDKSEYASGPPKSVIIAKELLSTSEEPSAKSSEDQIRDVQQLVRDVARKTDGSIGLRFQMLLIGLSGTRDAWFVGNGNLYEKQKINELMGGHHPHLHNQHLSFLTAGGIFHLVLGLMFICAPLINHASSKARVIQTLPIIGFVFVMFCFTSFLQIQGWQNLYIIYSFVLASYLPSMKIAE